jgi:CRISPR-associated protein Cas5h
LKELLVFDTWAPFAYFRKSATTTTSLTYAFMPRSGIEGLIGSFIGFKSEDYPERLKDANIALQIINRVSKMPFSIMHTHTDYWTEFGNYVRKESAKSRKKKIFRAPARIEVLNNPHYRIYLAHDEILRDLKEKLLNHETIFTPYLGSSSMVANFDYLGSFKYCLHSPDELISVSSVIPFFEKMPTVYVEPGQTYAIEQNMPIHLTNERLLMGTFSAVYSPSGNPIKVKGVQTQEVIMGGHSIFVAFMPTEIASR